MFINIRNFISIITVKYFIIQVTKSPQRWQTSESIGKSFIGNLFHVTVPILSSKICKQCLRVESSKPKERAAKTNKLNSKINKFEVRHATPSNAHASTISISSEPYNLLIFWSVKNSNKVQAFHTEASSVLFKNPSTQRPSLL